MSEYTTVNDEIEYSDKRVEVSAQKFPDPTHYITYSYFIALICLPSWAIQLRRTRSHRYRSQPRQRTPDSSHLATPPRCHRQYRPPKPASILFSSYH